MIPAFRIITRDSSQRMIEASNTAAWFAKEETIRGGEYFVCVRPQTREPFFIARIERYEPVPESGHNRWALFFNDYAEISGSELDLSESSKNPFVRFDLEDALKVPLGSIEWKHVGERSRRWSFSNDGESSTALSNLSIQEAKRLLASSLGVRPDQIEITIRG
jgi:hypothetical protein